MTDQQRADTINALGAPWMKTPHSTSLVREGAAFTNASSRRPCAWARAPACSWAVPARPRSVHELPALGADLGETLADAGYHCVNIGKMHINPYDASGRLSPAFRRREQGPAAVPRRA